MIKMKPKNVSDAYILLDVIADRDGCKARLDELVAVSDIAVKEQKKADEDKRYAEVEMTKMSGKLADLRIEENKVADAKVALELSNKDLSEKVKAHHESVALLEANYTKRVKVLDDHAVEVRAREAAAAALMQEANDLMQKAKQAQDKAVATQAAYEEKLLKLKAMV